MKVYRQKKNSAWMDPRFHLIVKQKWMDGTEWHQPMMVLRVFTYCRKNLNVEQKGGRFEEYNKAIHKGQLCDDCVKMVQLQKRMNDQSQKKVEDSPQAREASVVPPANGTPADTVSEDVHTQESLGFTKGT